MDVVNTNLQSSHLQAPNCADHTNTNIQMLSLNTDAFEYDKLYA